jgi:GNAT superfamily N-acetyltransferase
VTREGASPAAVTFREASPDDAEAISALIVSLADRFLADPDDRAAAEPFFAAHGPEALRRTLSDDRFRYRVAEAGADEEDREVVGVVGVRDGSHLLHLFVAERHHRRGIAGRLWALAKAETLAAGNPGRFTVNSSLGALPVYERFGFVVAGEEVRKDGVAFVPMVLDERQA